MVFSNLSHEPILLLIVRFLFIAVCFIVFGWSIAKELIGESKLKNVYQTKYHTELIELPIILIRIVLPVGSNFTLWPPNFIESSQQSRFNMSQQIIPLKWNDNVVDSSEKNSIWSSNRDLPSELFNNGSALYLSTINPDFNITFAPKISDKISNANTNRLLTTKYTLTQAMQVINRQPRIENLATTTFKLDVFIIENPKLLIDAINFKKPVDLAEINARSRFTVGKGTDLKIDFLKSYREIDGKNEPIYDFQASKELLPALGHIVINIAPRNKPSPDMNGYMVKKEIIYYPFNFLHVSAVIGGILSLILIIYTFLFGQRRLRPWGIIQQYFIRSKILVALSRSMNNMRTAGQPESKKGVVKHTVATYVTNLQQQGTLLQPTKLMGPLGQQTSLISSTPFMPPPITNLGQQQSYAIVPPEDEIRELKTILTTQTTKIQDQRAQLEAQVKQLALVSSRLAALESNSCPENTNAISNELPINNNGNNLLNPLMAQNVKLFESSNNDTSFEARITNLETFQNRLGVFYLDSGLFKNN